MSEATKAVFLSYASQDSEAARRIANALRAAGVEVWFDTDGGLEHGDEWDAKIRRQIKECVLFIPIISTNTQAREEGYFRLEWDLAAERARTIASGVAFILPVVIDDTKEPVAFVPDRFRTVQWTRLPGGQVPAEVLQRFLKLWSHRAGMVKQLNMEHGSSYAEASEDRAGSKDPETGHSRPAAAGPKWLRPILASGAIVIAVLAITLFQQRDHATVAVPPPLAPTPVPVAASPVSAARQLVLRARELGNFGDFSREKLEAAGDLVEQALKLDPTDAMAWALAAQIDAFKVYRALDYSDERRETAAKRAARARALAPNDFETRHAAAVIAGFMRGTPEMRAEAESVYRQLLRERPHDADLLEEFGSVLTLSKHYDEAAAVFTEAGRPLLAGWAYFRAYRAEDALRTVERSLAGQRSADALVLKANVELILIGDRDAAQETVSQLTPTELLEESAAVIALRVAVLRRDPARILELLGPIPHAFVSVTGFTYPRQYWTGFAQSLLGHPEAAQAEWRRALAASEERLKSSPNNPETLGWVAVLDAMVGEKAAAERTLQLYASYKKIAPDRWDFQYGIGLMFLGDRKEEALDRVSRQLREEFYPFLYVWARYSPEFDPLRGDPRFEKMLRETLPKGAKPFEDQKTEDRGQKEAVAPDAKSVAVLAFADLSAAHDSEYFSDGISEELLNVLAKIPDLKVSARTSAFSFKGKEVAIPEIARQLGVAYVVEGSVRKQGDKVRITAQLIKAADGFHVWSDTFTRDLKDIFAVQDEIAGLIAQNLSLKLGMASAAAGGAVDPEAYRLVLLGRDLLYRGGADDLAQAQRYLQDAVARDEKFALAWAWLSITRWALAANGWVPIEAGFSAAREAAGKALALQPNLPEANTAMGFIYYGYDWDWARARIAFDRAQALAPGDAPARSNLTRLAVTLGQNDEAVRLGRQAVALDPLNSYAQYVLSMALLQAGRYVELEQQVMAFRNVTRAPAKQQVFALVLLGKNEEALRLAGEFKQDNNRTFLLALSHWAGGHRAEADASLARLQTEYAATAAYQIAELHAYRGETDDAFVWLETSYRQRDTGMIYLKNDPWLKNLHADPRWPAILKKMNLSDNPTQ